MTRRKGKKSFVRTGHGPNKGKPMIEISPPDELSDPVGPPKVKRGKPFQKGNKAAAGRRPKLTALGGKRADEIEDPEYRQCLRDAERYRQKRAREIRNSHGYLSSGAASILGSAALQLAMSRYWGMRAATDHKIAALASRFATEARQNELAAWELAAREAKAKLDQDDGGEFW